MAFSLSHFILRQNWLQPVETALQRGVDASLGAPAARTLRARELGYPPHVVLSDLPIGAWTTAMAFDAWAEMQKQKEYQRAWQRAARGAVAVGVAGALAAALTGLAEYEALEPPVRRLGLAHGLLNLTGTALFAVSLARRRQLGRGHRSALAGYVVMLTAARLGGDLVYRHHVGMSAAEPLSPPVPGAERVA